MNEDFPTRVLIVEDEEDLVEELIGELKTHWIEVNQAATVAYAVKATRTEKFDCIVVDYKLMAGTGDEVVRSIRSDKTNPNYKTPVILASGNLTRENLLSMKRLVEKVIAKPYRISELKDAIEELVMGTPSPDASILYVEDEESLAEEIIEELEDEGISVIHVISADAAYLQTKKQKFSCMIVDINLAIGKGDEFIERLRLDYKNVNVNTPIIVASSVISKPLINKVSQMIQGAIVKPYSIRDLFTKIKPFLKNQPEE